MHQESTLGLAVPMTNRCVYDKVYRNQDFLEGGGVHKDLEKAKAITQYTLSAKPLSRLKHT